MMQGYRYPLLCMALLSVCTNSKAQEKQSCKIPKNQLTFLINHGICFNKSGEYNDGINPDPIVVNKARDFKLNPMLSYQHNTPYGLIYGGGIQFSAYKRYLVTILSPYDTAHNMEPLNGRKYIFGLNEKSYYLGFNVFVGYYYCLTPKKAKPLCIETKIGITKRYYFSGGSFDGELNDITRFYDSSFQGYQPTYLKDSWGKAHNSSNFFDGYIGIRKQVDWICKNTFINLGAYCSFQFELPGSSIADGAETVVKSGVYKQGVFQYWDYDYYYNRELTFGIRAGFGLSF